MFLKINYKKIMKKITILLFSTLLFLLTKSVNAQVDTVHLSDINPVVEMDSSLSANGNIKLAINFKLDNSAQADSVFFMFGSVLNGAEIATEPGMFKKIGSSYYVSVQGTNYRIENGEASCKLIVPETQFVSSAFLSLIVKTKSGRLTNILSIRIN